MSLNERLNADMIKAMREKDKTRLTVIRMLRSAVKNIEIDQRKTLNDNEVIEVLARELKQRKDSLQDFEQAGRNDLVEQLQVEIAIVNEYLPQQMTEQELKELIQQTIIDLGASTKADMGKLMGALMPKVKGRADGKLVNQIVQQLLQ